MCTEVQKYVPRFFLTYYIFLRFEVKRTYAYLTFAFLIVNNREHHTLLQLRNMHVYIALDQYLFRNNMTNASGKERHRMYTLI